MRACTVRGASDAWGRGDGRGALRASGMAVVGALLLAWGVTSGCMPKDREIQIVPLEGGATAPAAMPADPHAGHGHGADPHGADPHGAGGRMTTAPADPSSMPDDDIHRPLRSGAQPAQPLATPPPSQVVFGRAPEGLVEERPASSMRLRQLRLPRVEGDPEDGSVVVFFFGGAAGGVQANIDRWLGQFQMPDGSSPQESARLERASAGPLPVIFVEVDGTFVAEMMPGSGDAQNKPGYSLLGAIVEGANGNYFIKGTGPTKTMQRWRDAVRAFVLSAR